MKFLHEYIHWNNGTITDNGYWRIDGHKLVNECGGWHDYNPRDDDEIIESTWEEIQKLNAKSLISDEYITGWIAPDGTFYGCDYRDHWAVGVYLDKTERMMETQGYVKIFLNPLYYDGFGGNKYDYYHEKFLTSRQKQVLKEKGLEIKNEFED